MIERLSRALYAQATRTLPALFPDARASSLAAIDRYVRSPSPSTFVAAARTLATALRQQNMGALSGDATRRRFQRGLLAVSTVPGLDAALADELSSLPLDQRAGRRLEALAALLTTHHELTCRVAAAAEELRRMLDFDSYEPSPAPKRRALSPGTR